MSEVLQMGDLGELNFKGLHMDPQDQLFLDRKKSAFQTIWPNTTTTEAGSSQVPTNSINIKPVPPVINLEAPQTKRKNSTNENTQKNKKKKKKKK